MMDAQFFNGLTEGDFGTGFWVLQSLVEGDFWVLGSGAHTIYRGQGNVNWIDYASMVYASANDGDVELPTYFTHQADTETFYALRKVSSTGKQEKNTTAIVKLALDETGKRKPLQPNVVQFLQAEQIGATLVRLSWWYGSLGQEAAVERFEVFTDVGSGSVDYANVMATVACHGDGVYGIEVNGGIDERWLFAVRSVAVSGTDDENLSVIEHVMDASVRDGVAVAQSRVVW